MTHRLAALSGLLALATLALPAPLVAQDTAVQQSSLASGNERLALFSLSKFVIDVPHPAALRALGSLMERQAFSLENGTEGTRGVLLTSVRAAPVIGFDDNINGGNRQSSFSLGPDITFTVDEAAIAKEGVVLGGRAATSLRYGYGRGRYAEASATLSAVHSPEHDLEKYAYGFELCSRNHVTGWTFADACLSMQRLEADLGVTSRDTASLGVTQLFRAAGADHALTVTGRQSAFNSYDQASIGADLTSSLGAPGVISVGFEIGEGVDGANAQRERISLGYMTTVMDRKVRLSYSGARSRGSSFLGDVREDETQSIGIAVDVTDRLSLGLRATDNASTVDFFSYSSISLDVNFIGYTF